MAEFCSQCSPFEVFDFDLQRMALDLKKGHSVNFLCEGCNNRAIYKDEEGRLYLAKNEKGKTKLNPVNFDEL